MLSIIVAMTDDRVIGKDNTLPWHIPEDLHRFKALTMGHPIIMGRRTFESIGKALPGRTNIVVTSQPLTVPGVLTARSLDEALALSSSDETFIIGGSRLFAEALPKADRLYITLIHDKIEGDTYFPTYSLDDFNVVGNRKVKGTYDVEYITAQRRVR